MQEKRTPVFQNEDGSWGHVTQTVNPLICTIEYKCHWETGIIMMINRILVMAKRERKDRQLQKLEAQEKRCRKEKK